jgi:microcompartment protein CcmK/EutM
MLSMNVKTITVHASVSEEKNRSVQLASIGALGYEDATLLVEGLSSRHELQTDASTAFIGRVDGTTVVVIVPTVGQSFVIRLEP